METLHLLNLEEFTDALLRNSFVILRMVATARYLHLKAQELHEALMDAHVTIGDNLEEKIRLRDQGPDIEASAQSTALLTDQLAAMSTKHQQAQAAATFNEERARNGMPTSFTANLGWPSRISFGPAMLTP